MRIWAKYLIVGWSIVTVAIVIISFQLLKDHFVEEDYEIMMVYKVPEKVPQSEWEVVASPLFPKGDIFDSSFITRKQFVERMKKAKGVTIESKKKVKDNAIYLYLPLYVFAVWMVPILVFSLIGLLFSNTFLRGASNGQKTI